MATETIFTYRKNPNYGQPGEPEMLPVETSTVNIVTAPRVLSATAFMDVAIAGIKAANNSSQAAAEARFFNIIEAAKTFTNGDADLQSRVRYVHERYTKAVTFNKSVVTGMLALFKAAGVASLTTAEDDGILAAWPES